MSDGGVVIVRIRNNARQSVPDAHENLAAAVSETAGRRRPLLVEASPMGTMMGNVYLRVARLGIPTKLFTSEPEAMQWLDEHRADADRSEPGLSVDR